MASSSSQPHAPSSPFGSPQPGPLNDRQDQHLPPVLHPSLGIPLYPERRDAALLDRLDDEIRAADRLLAQWDQDPDLSHRAPFRPRTLEDSDPDDPEWSSGDDDDRDDEDEDEADQDQVESAGGLTRRRPHARVHPAQPQKRGSLKCVAPPSTDDDDADDRRRKKPVKAKKLRISWPEGSTLVFAQLKLDGHLALPRYKKREKRPAKDSYLAPDIAARVVAQFPSLEHENPLWMDKQRLKNLLHNLYTNNQMSAAELSVYRASVDTPARVGWPADDAFRTYVCNLCLGGELDMDKKPSQISDEAREDMLVRFPALTNADPKWTLRKSIMAYLAVTAHEGRLSTDETAAYKARTDGVRFDKGKGLAKYLAETNMAINDKMALLRSNHDHDHLSASALRTLARGLVVDDNKANGRISAVIAPRGSKKRADRNVRIGQRNKERKQAGTFPAKKLRMKDRAEQVDSDPEFEP